MRVEELEGVRLNYWTAKAVGVSFKIDPVDDNPIVETETGWTSYNPVVDWSQCGPLIERFDVDVFRASLSPYVLAQCPSIKNPESPWLALSGWCDDRKLAVCRAVVESVYGEEVPDG